MIGSRRSQSSLLSLLLVGTLLVCHGAFGALHLCSAPHYFSHQTHELSSSTVTGNVEHEHPVCHLMDATVYFAVLLVAFLRLVLGLLKGARLWSRVTTPLIFDRRFCLPVSHPPRGPTLPVLQMFRL